MGVDVVGAALRRKSPAPGAGGRRRAERPTAAGRRGRADPAVAGPGRGRADGRSRRPAGRRHRRRRWRRRWCSQRPARGDHRAGRDRGTDVGETADDPDPADRQRVIADEGGARHGGVVLQLLHLLVGVAELLLDRLRAGQKTELQRSKPAFKRSSTAFCRPSRSWKTPTASRTMWVALAASIADLPIFVRRQDTSTRRAHGGCPRAL